LASSMVLNSVALSKKCGLVYMDILEVVGLDMVWQQVVLQELLLIRTE